MLELSEIFLYSISEYFCVVKGAEGSRYFCFDVRILKWYIGIFHTSFMREYTLELNWK